MVPALEIMAEIQLRCASCESLSQLAAEV